MASPSIHRKPVPSGTSDKHDIFTENPLSSWEQHHHDAPLSSNDKGKGKARTDPSAFAVLPKEIIQQILFAADPSTFDSLTLVNSRWYQASRSSRLYAHQLSRCGVDPPVAVSNKALPSLVKAFALSARRELFETVLNPAVTEVQLIYSASCSTTAVPGGEAFRFRFSPKGSMLLALSSSRIFAISLSEPKPVVLRELKVRKRPSAAAILDDGTVLAILNANHTVALYDLRGTVVKLMRSFPLENEPKTIALSPGAEVLGAAYDGGIEVYSLLDGSGPTDRRSVNCDSVDSLEFSLDGTVLLGTAMNSKSPTTVLVSAQHFSIDMPVEGLAQLWTTQVLFPRSSRDSSHASLLPAHEDEEASWTVAYDRVYQTFRAVRVEDLRNGHTYFTGPNDEEAGVIPPLTLPTSARDGSLVAAGFSGGRIWLYGVPEKLDSPSAVTTDDTASITTCSTPERTPSNASRVVVPQWQVLSERFRNVFVRGREVAQIPGLVGIRFVQNRLVAVAGGGVSIYDEAEERTVAAGGGRIVIIDFSASRCPTDQGSASETIIIEVGDGIQGQVETLKEINQALETEIDLARRRTIRRTAPTSAPPRARRSVELRPPTPPGEDPYTPNAPRSATTLQRAATVVRPVDPARYARVVGPDGRPLPPNHRERMIGNLRQEPWEPPPPPYTPRDDNPVPLPPHILQTLQPPPVPAVPPMPPIPRQHLQPQQAPLQRARSTIGNLIRPLVAPINTTVAREEPRPPLGHHLARRGSAPLTDLDGSGRIPSRRPGPLVGASISATDLALPRVPIQQPVTPISPENDASFGRPAAPPVPRFPINRSPSQIGRALGSRSMETSASIPSHPLATATVPSPEIPLTSSFPIEHYSPVLRPPPTPQVPQAPQMPPRPPTPPSTTPMQERVPAYPHVVRRVVRGPSVRRRASRAERTTAAAAAERRRRATMANMAVGTGGNSRNVGSENKKKKGICVVM
ncbi:hypothetical protein EX30DRAFT_344971 [Ascodesmis nigricans]|uniref:F-box domain-containing protein n=1 Tax=Ascodesmis nigricans TaxID=341454 RepID=A0A4S2MHI9_9PEZI|nr:hypothetical protein EX30DRAFT_344971 [Ascodesmis nigricans]